MIKMIFAALFLMARAINTRAIDPIKLIITLGSLINSYQSSINMGTKNHIMLVKMIIERPTIISASEGSVFVKCGAVKFAPHCLQ